MKSSFVSPPDEKKEPKKSAGHVVSISAEHVLTTFAENRLLVRGLAADPTGEKHIFDELSILFGDQPQIGEPKTIDYTRRRAVSCSLMVPQVPMSMFSKLGLLFDADASTVRFLSKTDAWTDFNESADGVLWGAIDAESGKQIPTTHSSKKWLPPTVNDLAIHMRKLYEEAISSADEKAIHKVILDHNEIKANLFKQGLLGLYAELFNKNDYANLFELRSQDPYLTQEFLETWQAPIKACLLKWQTDIALKHQAYLPIFFWDCAQGKIYHWSPSNQEKKELEQQIQRIEKSNMMFEWMKNSSLEELRKFLTSLSMDDRQQFLHQYSYDQRGTTPLIHLIRSNQSDKVAMFIKEFAVDVNQRSLWNEIPLVLAVTQNLSCSIDIIQSSRFNNNLSTQDKQLDIAAREAALVGNIEMVKWLKENGAATISQEGINLIELAKENEKPKIESKENHNEILDEAKLLKKWKERLQDLFGEEFALGDGNESLFINPDSIEVCFKNKDDSDKFKSFFYHPEVIEEYGLFVVKLQDLSDQAIFFNCLETMKIPDVACAYRRHF